MKKLVLASLILVSSQMAVGANWVLSQASSKDDREIVHIDFDSVQGYYFNGYDKNNYYVTSWIKSDFSADKILVSHGGKYRQRLDLWHIDCINKKTTTAHMVFYDSLGKLVFNSNGYVTDWNRVVPGSIGEQIATEVCDIYQFKLSYQK